MRNPPERLSVPRVADESLDIRRVDDQAVCGHEHLACEWVLDSPVLPERRQELVDHTVRKHSPHRPGLPLHRIEIATSIAAAESHARHQVVEDEIVQNDDAGTAAESLDDPTVRCRLVADVVERDVCSPALPARPSPDHVNVDPLRQRRKKKRAVVGDPRPLGRLGRVVRDLHASKRSIAASQVSCLAARCPARPYALVSSG